MKLILALLITLATNQAQAQTCSHRFTKKAMETSIPTIKNFTRERFDAEENQILEIKANGKVRYRHSRASQILFYGALTLTSPIWLPFAAYEEYVSSRVTVGSAEAEMHLKCR